MSIYTKKGDQGKSSLLGYKLLDKDDLHFEALGCLDEASCFLGLARCYCPDNKIQADLKQIQHDLIGLCSSLAGHQLKFDRGRTRWLEKKIDLVEKKLPKLTGFILPGETVFASHLHLARAVVRRTERVVIKLNRKEKVEPPILIYINRLSDYLFVLARLNLL